MALMLRSVRPLKPAINAALPLVFQSKTETWSRLAIQKMAQMRKTTVMKRCIATKVDEKVDVDYSKASIQKMDRILQQLDNDVRKTGRIGKGNVLEILNEIKLSGSVTSTQSLLLIRCCGSLLASEFPIHRIELLNKVLALLKSSNVAFDTSHYNAILKVHLENGCNFSPTEFLANMEAENIEPNRVTYQRLVSYFCQEGDINGASKILEYMKSKNLPINENVFNALIKGHAKQGDMENARAILDVMRTAKLEPTSDTYLNLICGYAEKGDGKQINILLTEAEKNDVSLPNKDILEIIYTLAVNGHLQLIDEMLTKLKKQFGYNQDVINMTYRLVNNQQDDVAFKLLLSMTKGSSDGDPVHTGQFFIRQLVKVERPFEKILHYCDELKNHNLNSVGILRAIESSFMLKNPVYALGFINVLHERGLPIRPHYFWPILACYKDTTSKIFEILQTMNNFNCPPNFDTFLDFVYPNCDLTDVDECIQQLKNLGISTPLILNPLVTHLVMQKKLNSAVKIVRTYPLRLMGYSLIFPLARAAVEMRDIPSAIVILKKLDANREEVENSDWGGLFLREYFKETEFNSQKLEELLSSFKENQISINSNAANFAKSKFKGNVPSAINDLLEILVSSSFGPRSPENTSHIDEQDDGANFRQMSLNDLENYYAEQKSKNKNVRAVLRKLFFIYCQVRDLEKAEQTKGELDSLGFIYSASMYVALLDLYIRHELLDKALECHKKLIDADSNFSLDESKCLNLANLLIKNNRYDDAERILASRSDLHSVKQKPEELLRNNWRLLNTAADTKNPEVVSRFSELLYDKGFAVPNNMLLGALVKVQLLRDNVDEALKVFENCCKKYSCTPWKNELLTHFIKQEDADRLQKVVDLSSDVHGEMNALYDLAFVFIINNQFKQARKVLETPGLRARSGRLKNMCDRLINDNKITQLEQLVTITKDIFDIDRDEMYFQLLRGYNKLDDTEKALGTWTSMQEENVQPRNRTLVYLAELLKRHNKPVPFLIPNDDTESILVESTSNQNNQVQTITTLIANNKVDQALLLRQKFESGLTANDLFIIIESLLKKDHLEEALDLAKEHPPNSRDFQIRVFKYLLSKLAAVGKVDEILSFKDDLHSDVKIKSDFDNYLAKSYAKGNRIEDLLKWLESDFPRDKTSFPNRIILDILMLQPKYTNRIYAMAKSFAENNNVRPLNVMWNYYFIQENYAKADEIYKSTPSFQEKLMFIDVIRVAKENNNENMASKLLELVKSSRLNNQIKSLAYGALVDILDGKHDYKKALGIYNDACNSGIQPTLFKHSTLSTLKKGLEKQGVAVPTSLASQLEILNSNTSGSSESSDDEKEKHN